MFVYFFKLDDFVKISYDSRNNLHNTNYPRGTE